MLTVNSWDITDVVSTCFNILFQKIHGLVVVFPQQRELIGSSAQIGSGVCRTGGRRKGSEGSRLEGSGVCRWREGSGRFWCRARCRLQAQVPEGPGFPKISAGLHVQRGCERLIKDAEICRQITSAIN